MNAATKQKMRKEEGKKEEGEGERGREVWRLLNDFIGRTAGRGRTDAACPIYCQKTPRVTWEGRRGTRKDEEGEIARAARAYI